MAEVDSANAGQIDAWNGANGRVWVARQERLDAMLAPVSTALFGAVDVASGMRALDIGCGCGDTTFELARRVGSGGRVTGVDISAPMLARARERVTPETANAAFIEGDATVYPFPSGAADLLFSRFGVMFFADPARAFANMRMGLRPGARLAFACWRELGANEWQTVSLQATLKHVPPPPPVDPNAPGQYAFANRERVRGILEEAGFDDVTTHPVDLQLDSAIGRGLDAAVETAFEIGPVSRLMREQPDDLRPAVAASIREAYAPRMVGQTLPLAAAIWIVTARNP